MSRAAICVASGCSPRDVDGDRSARRRRRISPGEWVLDRTASMLQAESAAVESGTIRIEHRDPSFRFARTFVVKQKPFDTAFDINTDGREVARAVAERTSRSRLEWQGRSLLLTVAHRDAPRRGEQRRPL